MPLSHSAVCHYSFVERQYDYCEHVIAASYAGTLLEAVISSPTDILHVIPHFVCQPRNFHVIKQTACLLF